MPEIAELPEPPYYAVIFTNKLKAQAEGYAEMAALMEDLAKTQPGYLGRETARDADGFAVTVSYWRNEADLLAWKAVAKHRLAQKTGRERWYLDYSVRVAKVERAYAMD